MTVCIERPAEEEYNSYFQRYTSLVPGNNALSVLEEEAEHTAQLFLAMKEEQALYRYADGKWTPKELLLHCIDTERIMCYRALCIARGDARDLPGFDEDLYAASTEANERSIDSLVTEFRSVRAATCTLFKDSLPLSSLMRKALMNGYSTTVRSFAWIIAGHELHHREILLSRYLRQG